MLSTDRQTDKQTNATKNITSFAKEVKTKRQYAYRFGQPLLEGGEKDETMQCWEVGLFEAF